MMTSVQGACSLQKSHAATNRTNSAFNSVFGNRCKIVSSLVCLYNEQNNIWLLVDMEFLFRVFSLVRNETEWALEEKFHIHTHPCIILYLLHIMCGYQCDKAVTKNDTREVIWYHFTAVKWYHITSWFELSNQIDCNNLVGPIRLHVIF